MSKRVLVLLAPGFEEIETVTPVDLLRRAGAEVVLASVDDELMVRGRSNIVLQADSRLEEINAESFDLLLIPGGPGVQKLREEGSAARLAVDFVNRGRPVAAICAAPTVLKDAGLLKGKRFTAHFSVHAELPTVAGVEKVVHDGHILTSRGAGTALEFGLALVSLLYGEAEAARIAASIMA